MHVPGRPCTSGNRARLRCDGAHRHPFGGRSMWAAARVFLRARWRASPSTASGLSLRKPCCSSPRAWAPGAQFVAGVAESLPIGDRAVDLIAAAGSLNYVDLGRFFAEASRVLAADGVVLAYDFPAGRSFATAQRWMSGSRSSFALSSAGTRGARTESRNAGASGAGIPPGRVRGFRNRSPPDPQFYLDYVLTETNVAAAVRRGVELAEVRRWCADSLAPVWRGRSARGVVPRLFRVLAAYCTW
jgi:SAM-dependent methyltransferase